VAEPVEQRDPWVLSDVLRDIVREAPADGDLPADLADVREALVEEDAGLQI
jgi:hypothetical protein